MTTPVRPGPAPRALPVYRPQVGVDMSAVLSRMKATFRDCRAQEQSYEAEERKWKYEARESITVIVEHHAPWYVASPAVEIDGVGPIRQRGLTAELAIMELRFDLARRWTKAQLCRDHQSSLDRAAALTIYVEVIGAK